MQGEGGDSSVHAGREKEPREPPPPSHPDTYTLFAVCASVFVLCQKRVICGVTMKDFFKIEITFFLSRHGGYSAPWALCTLGC